MKIRDICLISMLIVMSLSVVSCKVTLKSGSRLLQTTATPQVPMITREEFDARVAQLKQALEFWKNKKAQLEAYRQTQLKEKSNWVKEVFNLPRKNSPYDPDPPALKTIVEKYEQGEKMVALADQHLEAANKNLQMIPQIFAATRQAHINYLNHIKAQQQKQPSKTSRRRVL